MNKESLYFITSLRSNLIEDLNESLNENDKQYIIENFSDGDVLSLSLIGKTIPEGEDKQAYSEGLLYAFSEMFFDENELQLEIDANKNSFSSLLENNIQEVVSREDDFFPDEDEPTPAKKTKPNFKSKGFDNPHPSKNTNTNHTASGFDDPKPRNHSDMGDVGNEIAHPRNIVKHKPHVRVPKVKQNRSDMSGVSNEIVKQQNAAPEQSSFNKALGHFKNFFTQNGGRNLKIGLGVAAASAAAYGAYKLYKAKFGDANKAKNAQVAQLNKAKGMASKTNNPNKYKQMLQDKINKIRRG